MEITEAMIDTAWAAAIGDSVDAAKHAKIATLTREDFASALSAALSPAPVSEPEPVTSKIESDIAWCLRRAIEELAEGRESNAIAYAGFAAGRKSFNKDTDIKTILHWHSHVGSLLGIIEARPDWEANIDEEDMPVYAQISAEYSGMTPGNQTEE